MYRQVVRYIGQASCYKAPIEAIIDAFTMSTDKIDAAPKEWSITRVLGVLDGDELWDDIKARCLGLLWSEQLVGL